MSKNKKSKNNIKEENINFIDKIKSDKRYSAKVQIIGYGIFILLIIIFLNINNSNNNFSNGVSNTVNDILDEKVVVEEKEEDVTLLEKLDNNYNYDVIVNLTKTDGEVISNHYYGKSYNDNVIINKEFSDTNSIYYEVDGYYYIKNENNEYGLIERSLIFNLIDGKYVEVDGLLDLIDDASLEHIVDSSTGAKESLYSLLVRDVVISNKTEDKVTIKVVEDGSELSVNIDYTNLIKVFDSNVSKCEVSYVYTNIGSVEEFDIMNNN